MFPWAVRNQPQFWFRASNAPYKLWLINLDIDRHDDALRDQLEKAPHDAQSDKGSSSVTSGVIFI